MTQSNSDLLRQLMIKSQSGDSGAHAKLLAEIYPIIRRFLVKKLGSIGNDEDFVQECIITIHNVRHTYDSSRDFMPWLFAVVRNKSVDILRKKQSQWSKEIQSEKAMVTFSTEDTYNKTNGLSDEDKSNLVVSALETLPNEMKRAVQLTKLDGLSTEEAASREGVTPFTLRARVSRAYKLMRKILEKDIAG